MHGDGSRVLWFETFVLYIVSPTLLFVLLIVGMCLFVVTSMFHEKIKKRSLEVLNNNAKVVDDIEQSLHGIELIKGLALEEKKHIMYEWKNTNQSSDFILFDFYIFYVFINSIGLFTT